MEMKFRAWDILDKRFIVDEQEFIPLKVTNKGILRLNPCHKEAFWEIVDKDRCIITWYTGINDINNNEIYIDDIVEIECENKAKIEGLVIFKNGTVYVLVEGKFTYPLFQENAKITIVGNKYE